MRKRYSDEPILESRRSVSARSQYRNTKPSSLARVPWRAQEMTRCFLYRLISCLADQETQTSK